MTQDDVIRWATQARLPHDYETQEPVWLDRLEAFAKLVAEHERKEFAVHAVDIARRAIAEEREACAKLCEEQYEYYGHDHVFAKAIRARGEN